MIVSVAKQPPRRVLIVRPSALGDVCRTVPALVTLRRALPASQIDWLVCDQFAGAVRHHPDLDSVVRFPRQMLGRLFRGGRGATAAWAWLRRLGCARYDLAIDLQGLLRSGLMTWWSRAPQRVGYANAREWAWPAYTHRYRIDRSLHTVDRMLELLEAAGFAPHRDMRLHVGSADRGWCDRWRQAHGVGRYVCLAPTARWRCKCWPIDRYGEIARRILACGAPGQRIVLLAAPAEREQLRPLVELPLSADGPLLCPLTDVGQMLALLEQSDGLVANDSGSLHMAVGLQRPVVAIFGPTDPALVGPYGRADSVVRAAGVRPGVRYRGLRDDQTLIGQITVEAVWQKVLEQLAPGSGTTGPVPA